MPMFGCQVVFGQNFPPFWKQNDNIVFFVNNRAMLWFYNDYIFLLRVKRSYFLRKEMTKNTTITNWSCVIA